MDQRVCHNERQSAPERTERPQYQRDFRNNGFCRAAIVLQILQAQHRYFAVRIQTQVKASP